MKKRRVLSAILAVIMTLTMTAPAFALEVAYEPTTAPCDEERIYDSAQADIIEESYARDANKPTAMFNLDGKDYHVNGTFNTTIYTSYYFYPNAQGELFYNMTFQWQVETAGFPNLRGAKVECWDKTQNKRVTEDKFDMKLQANGLYSTVIETGGWRVYNLDPTHQYYFRFTKSFDGINANVTGVIHT